jgi:hypothetical protein
MHLLLGEVKMLRFANLARPDTMMQQSEGIFTTPLFLSHSRTIPAVAGADLGYMSNPRTRMALYQMNMERWVETLPRTASREMAIDRRDTELEWARDF